MQPLISTCNAVAEASTSLLNVCFSCPAMIDLSRDSEADIFSTQLKELREAPQPPSKEGTFSNLVSWVQYEKWLLEQLAEYRAMKEVKPSSISSSNNRTAEEWSAIGTPLLNDYLQKQNELFDVTEKHEQDAYICERILQFDTLQKVLAADETENADADDVYIREVLRYRDEGVKAMSELLSKLRVVNAEIDAVQQRLDTVSSENRALWSTLDTAKGEIKERRKPLNQDDAAGVRKAQQDAELAMRRNILARNVLQMLILESGVNWAENAELLEAFMDEAPILDLEEMEVLRK